MAEDPTPPAWIYDTPAGARWTYAEQVGDMRHEFTIDRTSAAVPDDAPVPDLARNLGREMRDGLRAERVQIAAALGFVPGPNIPSTAEILGAIDQLRASACGE